MVIRTSGWTYVEDMLQETFFESLMSISCHGVRKHTIFTVVAMAMRVAMGMLMPILVPVVTMVMTIVNFVMAFTMVMLPSARVMVAMVMLIISCDLMAVTRRTSVAMTMGLMLSGTRMKLTIF